MNLRFQILDLVIERPFSFSIIINGEMHKESRSTRQGKQEVSTRNCSLNKARNERYDKDRMENIRLRDIGERSVAWKADGRKG